MGLRGGGRLTSLIAAVLLVSACGVQTGNSVPQAAMAPATAHRASGSSGPLLYAGDGRSDLVVLSYPDGKPMQTLNVASEVWGLCSDTNGNVFVVEHFAGQIVEYAHGGMTPINTLPLSTTPAACASDATSGNLAVVDNETNSVSIFTDSQGVAKTYADTNVRRFQYRAYDGQGNLFLVASLDTGKSLLVEFTLQTEAFRTIIVNGVNGVGPLQWDGSYLAIITGSNTLERVAVSGSTATVVDSVSLNGARLAPWMWIQRHKIMLPILKGGGHDDKAIDFWAYPSGGNPKQTWGHQYFHAKGPIRGVTISVAPNR